jgi:hypothetical protein
VLEQDKWREREREREREFVCVRERDELQYSVLKREERVVWGYVERDRQRLCGMTINTKKKRLRQRRRVGVWFTS